MLDTALSPLQVLNYLILTTVLEGWVYYSYFYLSIYLSMYLSVWSRKDLMAPRAYYGNKTLNK